MAKTEKDIQLNTRIRIIIDKLQKEKKTDKEIIYLVAGLCNISHRTASEHFHALKAQQSLKDFKIDLSKDCIHEWSNAYSTPGGLAKECRVCGKVKFIKIK